MSNLELIERLCCLLDMAQEIIRTQASLLMMHGIESFGGELETRRRELLKEIEGGGECDRTNRLEMADPHGGHFV